MFMPVTGRRKEKKKPEHDNRDDELKMHLILNNNTKTIAHAI